MTLRGKPSPASQAPLDLRRYRDRAVRCILLGVLALLAVAAAPASAQSAAPAAYSQDQLDQLLAPIALYPDQLLTQTLIAATYPLEVVEAARFVQQQPDLHGDALDQALVEQSWDPSVKSLAAYPQVLAMMNDNLEWTQRLGDAFLVDQARVMDTVQSLRQKALAAGNLQSTPQWSVTAQNENIAIDTTQPDAVYVPIYNPQIIYGPWWAPAYPPWFWCPPPIYGYPFCPVDTVGIVFGVPWPIWYNHWGWARTDWGGHQIVINDQNNRFWNGPGHPRLPPDGTWQHSPQHRRGVAYPDTATRDRFVRIDPNAVRSRQDFRGYERVQPAPGTVRQAAPAASFSGAARVPLQQATIPTFDPSFSRQQVLTNAQRGVQSRQSIPAMSFPAARAPSVGPAPHPSASGGPGRR